MKDTFNTEAAISKLRYGKTIIPLATSETGWQPDADMQWAKQVFLDDVQEGYEYKILFLMYNTTISNKITLVNGEAIKTSDGSYYTYTDNGSSVTHIWDDSNAKQSNVEDFKLRWVIRYSLTKETGTSNSKNWLVFPFFYLCHNREIQYLGANSGSTVGLNAVKYMESVGEGSFNLKCGSTNGLAGLTNLLSISDLAINGTSGDYLFNSCLNIEKYPEIINNSENVTSYSYAFQSNTTLKKIPKINTSLSTNFSNMFYACRTLIKIKEGDLATEHGENFRSMFEGCYCLLSVKGINTSSGTNFYGVFQSCHNLREVDSIDLRNATSANAIFSGCLQLNILKIYNINTNITLGSGAIGASGNYGCYLSIDSLLNAIKELWDNTDGTSTKTLTVGTENKAKLANVYIKLIDITDEMRAEDEFIDLKLPFEVCENTDEGAMLITDYISLKNWQLA